MYKIYINDHPLILTTGPVNQKPESLIAPYPGKIKFLPHYIDLLEKSKQKREVVLLGPDPDQLMDDFSSLYKVIEAAGGLVTDPEGRVLFIYRRDSWDLPKGKIDPGETPETAAVREVEEETGLQGIELGEQLHITYHTYKTKKGKRILKKTYWYRMSAPTQELTPQTEEDIELAVWELPEDLLKKNPVIYGNIMDVLER